MRCAVVEDIQSHQEGLLWGQSDPKWLSGSELSKILDLGTEVSSKWGGRKHRKQHPWRSARTAALLARRIVLWMLGRSWKWSDRGYLGEHGTLLLAEDFEKESCRVMNRDLIQFLVCLFISIDAVFHGKVCNFFFWLTVYYQILS